MTGTVAKLRDDDSEWGLTRVDYSMLQRRAIHAQRRARRALWLQYNVPIQPRDGKGHFVASPKLNEGDVFMTSSGAKAYRKRVPNRLSLTSAAIDESSRYEMVSLPYVSILFGSAS